MTTETIKPRYSHKAERENFKGRFCPCGRQATAWSYGYVCDRCRSLERDRNFTMAEPPIKSSEMTGGLHCYTVQFTEE